MAPSKKTPVRIQLRNSHRWVEIDDFEEANEPSFPLKPSSSVARTRVRPSERGRSHRRIKPPSADASFDDDSSEDCTVPKEIGRSKKRDAPHGDHSSEDAPQDGKVDVDDDSPRDGDDEAEDTPQDGLGNPNVSGIAPPIPTSLVESVLAGHETHFHVVTSGTEVGIFTNKGIADARLQCKFPSSAIFSTWALAMAHYTECFVDGSITVQPTQSSIKGPAQKKRRPNLPASTPKASGKVRSAFESPYSPLFFPDSPTPEQDVNRQKRPLSSCESQFPKYTVNRQKHPLTRSEVQARKALAPSLSTEAPLLSPFIPRAQSSRVYVDDDSDEEGTYAALVRLAAATPIASRNTPIIVHGSDSEEYLVSDIELTNDVLKLLDAPIHPTTAVGSAKVKPGVVEQRGSAIIVLASDSEEYEVSDIELDNKALRLLDEMD